MKSSGSKPTWTDVKTKLAAFDRAGLLGLVHDLYMAGKDNQAFLHARFALAGDDVLKPYKATIDRWLQRHGQPTGIHEASLLELASHIAAVMAHGMKAPAGGASMWT